MKKYMSFPFTYDWVVWTDCDTFFMDHTIPIDVLFTPAITNGVDLLSSDSSSASSTVDAIFSEDGNMLNTGFFILRTTKWALNLIEDAYDMKHGVFVNHPWWEQSSLFYLISNMYEHEQNSKIVYIHQEIVNPYPKEYSNQIHKHYIPNVSYILAFSGCNTYITKEKCNGLYEKYSRMVKT